MVAKIGMAVSLMQLFVELAKSVNEFVKLGESEDPDNGVKEGEKKKDLVKDMIVVIHKVIEKYVDLPIDKEELLGLVDSLIEIFVKFHNAIGNFRSNSK